MDFYKWENFWKQFITINNLKWKIDPNFTDIFFEMWAENSTTVPMNNVQSIKILRQTSHYACIKYCKWTRNRLPPYKGLTPIILAESIPKWKVIVSIFIEFLFTYRSIKMLSK